MTWLVFFSLHLASHLLLGATATSGHDDGADPLGDEIMALLVDGQRQRRREGSALSEIMGEVARAQAAAAATDRAEAEAKLAALQGGRSLLASTHIARGRAVFAFDSAVFGPLFMVFFWCFVCLLRFACNCALCLQKRLRRRRFRLRHQPRRRGRRTWQCRY